MKALLVEAVPCEMVRQLRPEAYIGYKIGDCSVIEHILLAEGKPVRRTRSCETCVLGQLVRHGHLLAPPTLTRQGLMRFIVSDTRETRRTLKRFRDQVVRVEEESISAVTLSPRQREAVSLLAGSASNISRLARELGISKTAAWKLVKKSLQKLAKLHA